ncbi:MAG: ABC transporter substrate-binding protein [Rhodobacteraceae bacterium]|nr:ABC transporter substrate-binding protein [Paracoccaceae bacterium]
MYGSPALPKDFSHLPYANPDAPKGGVLVTSNTGSFDSLNPFILKGKTPWQLSYLTHESLMSRSWDEPFTVYGLLAESVRVSPDHTWVEFTLRPEARFSDGSPVTVEDVIWSYEVLGTRGHPRYHSLWQKIARIEAVGPRKLRLTLTEPNRELMLVAGLRSIMKKAQYADADDFANSTLDNFPIGSAPYAIESYVAGKTVVLARNPDYWGKDLPLRQGTGNFDTIRIEFFGDGNALFEAFKTGAVSFVREFNAERWAVRYDFPAVRQGRIRKTEVPHSKPSGITGFVMNGRRAPFDDIRVRDAMIHAFNFEFINDNSTGQRQRRIHSYFSGSDLAMRPGPATGKVAALLAPFADLPAGTLEGYVLPVSDGTERNRHNLRKALSLLQSAGYSIRDGVMVDADGVPLSFEILLGQGNERDRRIVGLYRKALERLGITLTLSEVDGAQYNQRISDFDFDMTNYRRFASLSPGIEQALYWGSHAADQAGSRNLMGLKSAAMDAMIERLISADTYEDHRAAARAIDRILMASRYFIPIWDFGVGRIAHDSRLRYPQTLPLYGDGVYWMPTVWWFAAP